jgi:hypothetical protein
MNSELGHPRRTSVTHLPCGVRLCGAPVAPGGTPVALGAPDRRGPLSTLQGLLGRVSLTRSGSRHYVGGVAAKNDRPALSSVFVLGIHAAS